MDLTGAVDIYCERTDPSFWAEPVNALSNAAFVIAAAVIWGRLSRGAGPVPLARALVLVLALIGVGSFLFHTFAEVWAEWADVIPIGAFVVTFLFAMNRHVFGLRIWPAIGVTALFVPYVALTLPLFLALPFFRISAAYWPIALLIALYGAALLRRAPRTARGLFLGAALLSLSLTFRSLDMALCAAWPLGTHFLWHLLNGVMLGWMIETYRRHMLAGAPVGR